jgi:hypothetical protein
MLDGLLYSRDVDVRGLRLGLFPIEAPHRLAERGLILTSRSAGEPAVTVNWIGLAVPIRPATGWGVRT